MEKALDCQSSDSDELPDDALRPDDFLSVEHYKVTKVVLSTGGPHDEFNIYTNEDGEIVRIEYVFKDWFDVASETLSGSDFDTAEEYFKTFLGELQ